MPPIMSFNDYRDTTLEAVELYNQKEYKKSLERFLERHQSPADRRRNRDCSRFDLPGIFAAGERRSRGRGLAIGSCSRLRHHSRPTNSLAITIRWIWLVPS